MKELWNADIRFSSEKPSEEAAPLEAAVNENPYLILNIEHELGATEFEKKAIGRSSEAMRKLLARLGLPESDISAERIHILTDEEFREKISPRAEGLAKFGHVYLKRSENPVDFARYLTHEMCHAASHYGLNFVESAKGDEVEAWRRRLGFAFQPKGTGADDPLYFNGLNEGATELCARSLRKDLADDPTTGLDETQAASLKSFVEYRPWVVLTDALIRIVAKGDGIKYREADDLLLKDYFTGSFRFLKRLEENRKGSVKLLLSAGSKPQEAIDVAKALGLNETLRVIMKE